MASWGVRYIGIYKEISQSDPIVTGRYYEARFTTPIDIPDDIELALLTAFRGLQDQVSGQRTNYIYVKGRTVIIQWYAEHHSPITVGEVISAILLIAAAYAITMMLQSLYQVLSLVSPENLNMILNIVMMFIMMNFATTAITSFVKALPRRRRE